MTEWWTPWDILNSWEDSRHCRERDLTFNSLSFSSSYLLVYALFLLTVLYIYFFLLCPGFLTGALGVGIRRVAEPLSAHGRRYHYEDNGASLVAAMRIIELLPFFYPQTSTLSLFSFRPGLNWIDRIDVKRKKIIYMHKSGTCLISCS